MIIAIESSVTVERHSEGDVKMRKVQKQPYLLTVSQGRSTQIFKVKKREWSVGNQFVNYVLAPVPPRTNQT